MYRGRQYLAPEVRAKLEKEEALHEALYKKVLIIHTLDEEAIDYGEGSVRSLEKFLIEADCVVIYFKYPNKSAVSKRTFLKSAIQGWEEYEIYVG